MNPKTLEDILPLVEKPSRYLGSEINSIRKNPETVKLRFALAFPDLYEIGTSHFGLQIIYHILNSRRDIAAERVFAPATDMEACLREFGIPLMSLESKIPLAQFDIIGFSLLYELNYSNVLTMLDLSGIPFRATKRDVSYPAVIAGGPCTCNPEPIADFFDAIVLGEGEKVVLEMSQAWIEWKEQGGLHKETLLKSWSGIEGVYVPFFYETEYDENGFQKITPRGDDSGTPQKKISRAVIPDLNLAAFPDAPVIPYGKPIHDRLRLEISRGCTRGCRFCQAGTIYRPVRERSVDQLISLSEASIDSTGYEDISLMSLSTGDYGCILSLIEHLMARCESRKIAVSLPSIRAGTLSTSLMELIKQVRKTGFTIAPEAGSQRLRDMVNKNITDKDIFSTVEHAFRLGWRLIKLYFMIGLPFETDEDLNDIVRLVRDLRMIKGQSRRRHQINVSVTTFIPKPHTPFQWAAQIPLSESKEKIYFLKNRLNKPGIHFKWQNPEVSVIEGIWARGDRRLNDLLIAAYHRGCKFDGWSDRFKYDLWEKAFSDAGVDPEFYTTRKRDIREPLPWDHIDTRVNKEFLVKEWEKAARCETTPDCRKGICNTCGACDFKLISPIVFESGDNAVEKPFRRDEKTNRKFKTLKLNYSKLNQARYFGHLEMANIFLRALRRAKIPVKFSEGFHPMPRVSFDDPIPLGIESEKESLYLTVPEDIDPHGVAVALNKHLPEGLTVIDCRIGSRQTSRNKVKFSTYQITIKDSFFLEKEAEHFIKKEGVPFYRKDKKGNLKKLDLKEVVDEIDWIDPHHLQMTLRSEPGKSVRPQEAIQNIFNLPADTIKRARIVKVIEI